MKKRVDVYCGRAFSIGPASFAGKCINIVLDTEAIRVCLFNKAFVWELTKDGQRIPLDFSNYSKDNGGVVDDATRTEYDPRNRTVKVTNITFDANGKAVANDAMSSGSNKPSSIAKPITKKKVSINPEIDVETGKTEEPKKEEEKKEEVKASAEINATVSAEKKEEQHHDNNQNNNNNKNNNKYNKFKK